MAVDRHGDAIGETIPTHPETGFNEQRTAALGSPNGSARSASHGAADGR